MFGCQEKLLLFLKVRTLRGLCLVFGALVIFI